MSSKFSEKSSDFTFVPFSALDPFETGAKAGNLRRLQAHHFLVPPSWATPRSAIRNFLATKTSFTKTLAKIRQYPPHWEARARELREEILRLPEPDYWTELCDDFGPLPWLFRSNANFEDLGEASLSGAFASLPVYSCAESWSVLRKVVSSFFTDSAILRMLAQGFDPERIEPGVLVQPKLNALAAGVLFTRDPIDPWNKRGVLNYELNAHDGITSGSHQSQSLRRGDVPPAGMKDFWRRLWQDSSAIEEIMGCAQDLEWIWDGKNLYWVQARPITGELFSLLRHAVPGQFWTRALTEERFPHPVSRLGWTMIADLTSGNIETLEKNFGLIPRRDPRTLTVQWRGVIYSDPKFFSLAEGLSVRPSAVLKLFHPRAWRALFAKPNQRGLRLIHVLFDRDVKALRREWPSRAEKLLQRIASFESTPKGSLLEQMEELRELSLQFMRPDLSIYIIKMAYYQAIARAMGRTDGLDFAETLKLTDSKSFAYHADLRALSEAFRQVPEGLHWLEKIAGGAPTAILPEPLAAQWNDFFDRHGHVTDSWDYAEPNLAEKPEQVARLLLCLNASPEISRSERPVAVPNEIKDEWSNLLSLMKLDEDHHYDCGILLLAAKKLLKRVGREFVARGWIFKESDLSLLTLNEVKATLRAEGPSRIPMIEARRVKLKHESAEPIPDYIPPQYLATRNASSDFGASPGIARGQVTPIAELSVDPTRVRQPLILLIPTPSPAWIPYYRLACGIICKTGSLLSHGFIAAREYGIPAIVRSDISEIHSGQWVEINGSTGNCALVAEPGETRA